MTIFKKAVSLASIAILLLCSCGAGMNQSWTKGPVFTMRTAYEMQATLRQIDSICVADTLPYFQNWVSSAFQDYETGTAIIKRAYVKEYPSGRQNTYIITGTEEPYSVIKRIME